MKRQSSVDNPCMGNRRSQDDEHIFFYPGPLQLVYGSESPIKVADIARHIASAKKRRRNINHLSFIGSSFHEGTRTVFQMLGKKLRKIKHIKALSISNIPDFGNIELLSLAPFLNSSKSLRTLDLSGASFNGTAVNEIQRFFRRNSSLEVLNLGDNQCLGDDGVESIIGSLESNTKKKKKLQVLALNNCGIGNRSLSSISTFITQGNGRNLVVLELSNNVISDDGARMLGQVLKSNRSLHTLSLQCNTEITDLGASSILSSLGIYKASSINMIVGSNHVLKSLNLEGCNISSNLLNQVKQLSAQSQSKLLSTENGVIRLKVSDFLENKHCGVVLEEYDLELMPYILAFIGKSGVTTLYQTIKSMPVLCYRYSPQVKSLTNEKTVDNLFKLPTQSRRMRRYYDLLSRQISRHMKMVRYQDRRVRNKHEASSVSIRSNKSNKKRSLSSNTQLYFTTFTL